MKRVLAGLSLAILLAGPAGAQSTAPSGPVINVVAGQAKIATTGTAVQLNATSQKLVNGLIICAASGNAVSGMTVGGSSVTNTVNGTGNGAVLYPGQCSSIAISNVTSVYVNGTSGDILSYWGN